MSEPGSGTRYAVIVFVVVFGLIVTVVGLSNERPVGTAEAAGVCPDADLEASMMSEVRLQRAVFCLVNQERYRAGRQMLHPNKQLTSAVREHVDHMVERGFFSHDCLDGTGFADRIRSTGYLKRARSWLVGENLAWGSGHLSTPRNLVLAWMNSPSHRKVLLRPRYHEFGIAAVRGTPQSMSDPDGITVGTNYGCRRPHKKPRR